MLWETPLYRRAAIHLMVGGLGLAQQYEVIRLVQLVQGIQVVKKRHLGVTSNGPPPLPPLIPSTSPP
jgi:hypothetical protein